jgi:hypothetical protein
MGKQIHITSSKKKKSNGNVPVCFSTLIFNTVAASWTYLTVYCIVLKELIYGRGYTYIFCSTNMFNDVNCGKGPVFAYVKAWRTIPLEIHFIYLGNKEVYFIFKTCWILSVVFPTKCYLLHNFILFCSDDAFFHKAGTKI